MSELELSDTDKIIHQLFTTRWSGDLSGAPIEKMREQLQKNLQNQIDGFLEDPFVAAFTIKRKGLHGQIEAHPLEIHSGSVAMMFSKKTVDEKTVIAFNQALDRLQKNGEYQKILTKYRH